jgi:hypothetical protein
VSGWSDYGACNATTGKKSRTRTVTQEKKNSGAVCPALSEEADCNIDCAVSGWGAYGACNSSTGKKSRTRTVTQEKKNSGAVCPALSEEADCNIDCAVSGWTDYGACSKTCGGGKKTRTRTVTQEKKNSGAACPALSEEADCNTQACELNVVGWAHQFGSEGDVSGKPELWYQKTGTTSNVKFRLRDLNTGIKAPLVLSINDAQYAWPDIWVKFAAPYTGTVVLDVSPQRSSGGNAITNWSEIARKDVSSASSVFFGGVQAGTPPIEEAVKAPVVAQTAYDAWVMRMFGGRGSDIRLKTNLRKTGRKIATLDEYTWDWNEIAKEIGVSSDPTTGVIAQEAMIVYPDVVSTGPHGYFMVNYGRLRAIKE